MADYYKNRFCRLCKSKKMRNVFNCSAFAGFFIMCAENFEIERSQSVSRASIHVCFPLQLLHHENVGETHTPIFVSTFWHL